MQMNKTSLSEILERVYSKLSKEISEAYYNDSVDKLLEKYDMQDEIEYNYYDSNNSKILILGDLAVNKDNLLGKAKKMGINKEQIEFGPDYVRMHNFDYSQLRNNFAYSDVLVGPIPHKGKNIDGYSSFLAMAKDNPSEFPKIIQLESANELKITMHSFEEGIKKTRMYLDN